MVPMPVKRFVQRLARSAGIVVARPHNLYAEWQPIQISRFFDLCHIDTVLDVGANAGQYALMLRDRVGYRGPIISCEPIPSLAVQLREISSGDPAWRIEECAVSEQTGSTALNLTASDQFSSLAEPVTTETAIFQRETTVVRQVEVSCTTICALLDKYIPQFGSKSVFVKIDVQGTERDVVRGALGHFPAIAGIQLELSFKRIYGGSWSYSEAITEMSLRGFDLVTLFPNNAGHFPTLIEMDGIFRNTSRDSESQAGARA